jgi:hypothetical protein
MTWRRRDGGLGAEKVGRPCLKQERSSAGRDDLTH